MAFRSFLPNTGSFFLATAEHFFQASAANKLCRKVLRSKDAIEAEQKRQQNTNKYIIHPFSKFRWFWDLFMVAVLSVTLIILPVNIAFFPNDPDSHWEGMNIAVDVIFFIDIILNFRTGYIRSETEEVILSSKKITINYLKTWFFLDFISTVPFDYFFLASTGTASRALNALRMLRLTKLLSLLRVFRMARFLRYINRLEELLDIPGSVLRIINLVIMILLLSHWNGCVQYLVAFIEDFPENSWVVRNGLLHAPVTDKYILSVFRAMSHMLSIGYGRAPPLNNTEVLLVMISMLLGATFYALFIGHTSSLLLMIDTSGRAYNEKTNQAKEYMRYRRIPIKTQRRVIAYYEHKYQRKYFDEDGIIGEGNISPAIRQEILVHNCKDLVAKVPFLAQSPPDFMYDIISKLKFEVFLPGDTIIQAGRRGDGMFFIEHGRVDVKLMNAGVELVVSSLGDGAYFGEVSLILDERRVATIVAAEICDVFFLSKADFENILAEYPAMSNIMKKVAEERLQQTTQALGSAWENEETDPSIIPEVSMRSQSARLKDFDDQSEGTVEESEPSQPDEAIVEDETNKKEKKVLPPLRTERNKSGKILTNIDV
ncbi:potassium/sodium hyperpolarization-activated cyclic nucleotide-gated channel 2 [Lingula anatina]|uniref:Potassium/sodium hyperpolarization-activated cyclic nucleotide-gated channel 2 n=2 Tax=Lingula anatina TaxID=7574 RepID=A0A1S3IU48_LINAN|nr:potassium/sodium hyperpolarization-activated cyclic nucleotide-gated channel 2 [Lingula anatina]|eukprot:XP_013401461.1 potassium/sodium hyperpolarization-activated cyclic nucleotide-gated channel 2 [Lingula anatina]